ncbi:Os11g0417132, partial [Oryza sativa Japonica Group]
WGRAWALPHLNPPPATFPRPNLPAAALPHPDLRAAALPRPDLPLSPEAVPPAGFRRQARWRPYPTAMSSSVGRSSCHQQHQYTLGRSGHHQQHQHHLSFL